MEIVIEIFGLDVVLEFVLYDSLILYRLNVR